MFTACLRNADAVAEAAALVGHTFNECPAGERWPDGSLRPALEDWLGAGALLRRLPGTKSPEALAAIAAFETAEASLEAIMLSCSSGQELVERGYASDVRIAADYGVSNAAPILSDGVYINMNRSAADERLHLSSS